MADFAEKVTFSDIVERGAEQRGDSVFLKLVRRDGGREQLTFGDLREVADLAARGLSGAGAAPGDRVLIVTDNCLEQVIMMLAAARTSLISVPVNAASAPAELEYIVRLVEPAFVLAGSKLIGGLDRASLPADGVRLAIVLDKDGGGHPWALESCNWDDLLARDGRGKVTRPQASDPFQLLLTSGTTGRPKAVIHSHATRIRSAFRHVMHARVRDDDILLNPFPAFHINCLDNAVFPALVSGARAVIFEGFSASTFWEVVRREEATVVSVIPTVIRALLARPETEDDRDHSIRMISGALRPTSEELDEFVRRFGIPRYETGYGLTEASNAVTATSAEVGCRPPSMGIPLFDRTVDLVDDEGRSVGVGATGEVVVKCEPATAVMDGYWNDRAATEAAMVNGWLHTGDLARREEDGSYYFVGRLKDVIKRSGENVGAQEVESVVMEHPGVSEVAVLGVPDPYRDEAVMAVIVLKGAGAEIGLTEIREFCQGRLAEFKIPTIVQVVEELPKGLLGKVDKKALRLQFGVPG